MANTCINLFYVSVKEDVITDKHEQIYYKIFTFIDDKFELHHSNEDECFMEIEFDSKWSFPSAEMNELAQLIQQEFKTEFPHLYMRCLSYEFGCEYVDYVIFENGKWNSKMIQE